MEDSAERLHAHSTSRLRRVIPPEYTLPQSNRWAEDSAGRLHAHLTCRPRRVIPLIILYLRVIVGRNTLREDCTHTQHVVPEESFRILNFYLRAIVTRKTLRNACTHTQHLVSAESFRLNILYLRVIVGRKTLREDCLLVRNGLLCTILLVPNHKTLRSNVHNPDNHQPVSTFRI